MNNAQVRTRHRQDGQTPTVIREVGKVTRYPRSVIHKGVDGETVLGSDLVTGIQGDRVTVSYRSGNTLYPCHRPVLGPNHSKLF